MFNQLLEECWIVLKKEKEKEKGNEKEKDKKKE